MFDIGAGDGRFLISCAKSTGAHCTGIEINEERVQEALKVLSWTSIIVPIFLH